MNKVRKAALPLLSLMIVSAIPAVCSGLPVQIELSGVAAYPPSTWSQPSPEPENISVSFTLDTLSMTSSSYTFDNIVPNEPACLQAYRVTGADVSAVSVQADGHELWGADSLMADYRGNGFGGCPTGYFADLSFSDGTNNFQWSFDPFPSISQEAFVESSDPLADLFLGFNIPTSNFFVNGDSYRLVGSATQTLAIIPEPSTIALLSIGIISIGAVRNFKKH